MRVNWSDGHLQVVAGDEIKILRGKGKRESGQVLATKIENVTRGTNFKSSVEGIPATEMPHDFIPPIHGYAKNIEMHACRLTFLSPDVFFVVERFDNTNIRSVELKWRIQSMRLACLRGSNAEAKKMRARNVGNN